MAELQTQKRVAAVPRHQQRRHQREPAQHVDALIRTTPV